MLDKLGGDWFHQKEQKEYTITTPVNSSGKYVVPEVKEVPERYWGKICTNKTIIWDVEKYDNN